MTPEKNDRRYRRSRYRHTEKDGHEKLCVICGHWQPESNFTQVNRLGATAQGCKVCMSGDAKNDDFRNQPRGRR